MADNTTSNWEDFTPGPGDKPLHSIRSDAKQDDNWGDGDKPAPASLLRKAGDLGLSVAKGVIAVPEAAVGLADIATGGEAGKFLENEGGAFGFRPKQAKEYLSSLQSDDLQGKQREFQQADGIIDKTKTALSNPSLITNAVAESVPLMGAGAVPARAALAVAPKVGALAAGAIGEGVVGAGSAAEQVRQETQDGLLTPKQAGLAAASGAATAAFGMAGGKLAQRLGIGDVDTMLAQGAAKTAGVPSAKSIPRQVVEGAIAEGWLEELPQSVSEQILQNLSLNKPWSEGVEDAAVMGTLAGMAMGGTAAGVSGFNDRGDKPADQAPPPVQPPAPTQGTGPTLALPAPDRGVIQVGGDGTARTPAYQTPGYVGDVTDVEAKTPRAQTGDFASILDTDNVYSGWSNVQDGSDRATMRDQMDYVGRTYGGKTTPANAAQVAADLSQQFKWFRAASPEQRQAAISALMAPAAPIDPVREQVAAAAQQGGALSGAALTAIDTGVTQAMQPVAPEAALPAPISLEEADARDQAAYEQHWDSYDSDPVVSRYFEDDSDIPDFGAASNVSDEEFLRSLGATDEDIQDAIATARQSPIPQSSPAVDAGAQANEPAGPREGAGGNQAAQGQVATSTNLREGLAKIRAQKQQEAANAKAATPEAAPASAPVPAARPGAVEAAGVERSKLLASLDQTGATREMVLDAQLKDAQYRLAQITATTGILPADRASRLNAINQEIADLNAVRDQARELDERDRREGNTRSMLQGARQELDAAVRAGAVTPEAAQSIAAEAKKTGNAADAAEAVFAAVDSSTEGATSEPQATQAVQASAQPAQAAAAPAAEPTTASTSSPAAVGAPEVRALTDGTPAQNLGAQVAAAPGAKAAAPASQKKALDRVNAGKAYYFSQAKAQAFVDDNGLSDTHEVVQDNKRFVVRAKPAADDAGDVRQFAPETGTLGIPRAEMPQIPSQSHGGLVKHLNAQGIDHETTMVDAAELKPTQAEYSPSKVEAAKSSDGDRAVIVSSDGDIIDGHHQAMAAAEEGQPVKAIVLDAPVEQALEAVKNSPSAQSSSASDPDAKNEKPLWEGRAQPSQSATSEQTPFAVPPQEAGEADTIPSGQSEASVTQQQPAEQPITRTDVTAAKQQAADLIGAAIDAMPAGEVNRIAKKFLPTMGLKPTMSKAKNKEAFVDPKVNLQAAAGELGVTLPAEVKRALDADTEGRVADGAQVAPEPAAKAPVATDLTPKQFHEAKLSFIAADTGTPLSEVRENYDTEAGRAEHDREWAAAVEAAAQRGEVLTRQTLDKLFELSPNVRLPESAIPEGYQRPEARKAEAEEKQARVANRKAAKSDAITIADAGQKIGGARKDRWKERGLNLDDLDAMTEAEGAELATKANVWKPDYEALSEASEPVTAALVKTIYDQLAAKPKKNTPEGRRQYVQMMRIVRDVYTEAKGPEAVKNAYLEIRKRAGLNAADPAAKSAGRELLFSVYKGRSDPFVLGYTEMSKAKKLVEDGFPAKAAPWKSRLSVSRMDGGPGTTERGIEMYMERSAEAGTPLTREQILAGFYRVNTKDSKTVAYAPTKADAEAAAATIYERDMKGKKDGKPEPVRPNLDELKRENLPQRIDRDVTSEDFVRDLGFRGVEFGNWSAQDERQRILNMAYDGLMDLAEIMGVPPKAMSLNGTLGMAFGARGGGRFAAHYEPGKLVINMTKIRGGGSMAHEWAHAMDHYFGELDKPDAYTTQARGASGWYSEDQYNGVPRKRMERVGNEWKSVEKMRLDNLRPEMARAFDEVMQALFQKQVTKAEMVRSHELDLERTEALARSEQDAGLKAMYQNMVQNKRQALNELRNDPEGTMYAGRGRSEFANQAQALSGKSTDGYWVRPTEMFARAFESWVFDRVTAMGARSDYLVHGVEEDRFAGGAYKGNPYPTGEERARINAAFDKLADTIQTKETDKGVAMFSRTPETQDSYEARIDALFSGEKPRMKGARVLDRSDMVAFLGLGDGPVNLAESKVIAGQSNHPHMTAAVWKQIPEWLENPALVFESDTSPGRLVFIAPELVNDSPVRIVVEPNAAGGVNAHLLVNAYDAQSNAFRRWESDGLLRYVDRNKYAHVSGTFQPQLTGLPGDRGRNRILTDKQYNGYRRANTPAAFQGPAPEPTKLSNARLVATQMLVDEIKAKWTRSPEIIVARNMQDMQIPQLVRDYDAQLKSQGSDGEARGFIYKGKVYLLADQLNGPAQIAEVLFHEVLGHYGLRGAFGDGLTPVLQQIGTMRRAQVLAKAREYGMVQKGLSDNDTWAAMSARDRLSAAEEVLAEMAQTTPEVGFVQRAIAAIRTWLRANVPGFKALALTDDEIVRSYILPARGYVTRSDETPQQSLQRALLAFDRSAGGDALPMFSRSGMADLTDKARDELNKTFGAPGKLSWWHKTVGTMFNLAERSPDFKRVFDSAQGFVDDVSYYATDAAELAPRLLPKLETWRDIAKRPITAADNAAVAKPVFEGTLDWARDESGKPVRLQTLLDAAEKLTPQQKAQRLLRNNKISEGMLKAWQGLPLEQYEKLVASRYESQMLQAGVVWTPAELKSLFKLTDAQVELYLEFRAATDRSLDTMARADMLRYGGKDVAELRDMVMDAQDAQDAAQILRNHLQMLAKENPDRAGEIGQLSNGMLDRAARVQELQEQGYAPLSRFGQYTVDVVDANGERQYFGLFETARDANVMAIKMRKEFGQDAVTQGTLSNDEFKLLAGITPESLELFGNMLGLESDGDQAKDQAFQEYLRRTKTNRSAMRRLIHRQGIAGYSEDVGRVLASFIYSNSRQTSAGLHMGELGEAITAIPKQQGELKDAAIQLSEYVKNPQEEAQAVRGLLFAQYLGGSIASAFVNMSQPAAVTFPWLSQFGGAKQAAAELGRAAKNLANRGHRYEADLAAALKQAEEEGTVSPQEVHQLMAQARGSGSLRPGDGTRAGDARAAASNALTRLSLAWGKVFGAAEQVNRRMTFIAAYRVAKAQGMANPAAFAKKAVIETQFTYSKANKMKWGRGAVGATAMTFKTYSIAYLELLGRMWTQGGPEGKKAVLLALGMLMLMGGAGGLPFAEDAEDLVDGLAQLAGYNFNSKKAKQELLESLFGEAGAGFIERGITGLPGMPLDVSGRLGMGNLLPATGLFKEKTDYTRDVLEVVGPVGDLAKRVASGARSILVGDVGAGLLQMAPAAARNWAKGADMAATGMYRDDKGYKVLDTSAAEAAMKFIGFQPASVSKVQEANFINQQAKNFYNQQAQEIRAKWAKGIFEKDPGLVAEARADLEDWNRKNPDQRIVVSMPAVLKRVREMGKSKDQRIADTAPKAMRQQLREEAAKARATL